MVTTNDMPIVLPESFETMAIVPFQINPHYHPGKILFKVDEELRQHYGESRAQRISELHREVETPVLGMWEGIIRPLGRREREADWKGDCVQSGRGTSRFPRWLRVQR